MRYSLIYWKASPPCAHVLREKGNFNPFHQLSWVSWTPVFYCPVNSRLPYLSGTNANLARGQGHPSTNAFETLLSWHISFFVLTTKHLLALNARLLPHVVFETVTHFNQSNTCLTPRWNWWHNVSKAVLKSKYITCSFSFRPLALHTRLGFDKSLTAHDHLYVIFKNEFQMSLSHVPSGIWWGFLLLLLTVSDVSVVVHVLIRNLLWMLWHFFL